MNRKHLNTNNTFILMVLLAFMLMLNACEQTDLTPEREKLSQIKTSEYDEITKTYKPIESTEYEWTLEQLTKKKNSTYNAQGVASLGNYLVYAYYKDSITQLEYDAAGKFSRGTRYTLNNHGMVGSYINRATGAVMLNYTYNADGFLIKVSSNNFNVDFVINAGNLEKEILGNTTWTYYYYDNIQAFSQFSMNLSGWVDNFEPLMTFGRQNHKIFQSAKYVTSYDETFYEFKYTFDDAGKITQVYRTETYKPTGGTATITKYLYEFTYQK